MSKFSLFHFVVAIMVSTGCCVDRVYQPSQCNDGWDSILGSCGQCGSCGGGCNGQTPCQSLKHSLTCGAGCGDVYWGEWTSDPPDECDPCDDCGNWVGSQSCAPRWWERFQSGLAGWRYNGSCSSCGSGSCSSCGASYDGEYVSVGEYTEGEVIHNGPTLAPGNSVMQENVPTPSGTPKLAPEMQQQPKRATPATPAEPMLQPQTRHRAAPNRTAPKLLTQNQSQAPRHPSSVLTKSYKTSPPRHAAGPRTAMRPSPQSVKQATRFE